MDENNLLDPLNDLHLYMLYLVFLSSLTNVQQELLEDWNNHPLSCRRNVFPYELSSKK